MLFLGAGVPGAKAQAGYDFAIIDLEVDANNAGSGTLAPAAKVTVKNGAFVVEDYAGELVRLTAVAHAIVGVARGDGPQYRTVGDVSPVARDIGGRHPHH